MGEDRGEAVGCAWVGLICASITLYTNVDDIKFQLIHNTPLEKA